MVLSALIIAFIIQKVLSRGLPPEMGVALMLGFSTVGILTKQTQKITDAQKARGYDVKPKNIVKRMQVLTSLLIPIFLTTMERSQDISVSILSRGFDYNIKTGLSADNFSSRRDFVVIAILLLSLSVACFKPFRHRRFTEKFVISLLGIISWIIEFYGVLN